MKYEFIGSLILNRYGDSD